MNALFAYATAQYQFPHNNDQKCNLALIMKWHFQLREMRSYLLFSSRVKTKCELLLWNVRYCVSISALFLCLFLLSTHQNISWKSNWSHTTLASSISRRTLPSLRYFLVSYRQGSSSEVNITLVKQLRAETPPSQRQKTSGDKGWLRLDQEVALGNNSSYQQVAVVCVCHSKRSKKHK